MECPRRARIEGVPTVSPRRARIEGVPTVTPMKMATKRL
jgi:hypothetical protein